MRQKLYHATNTATAAFRLDNFFENPFVSRVNRRRCIRTVRFARSMCDVLTRAIFGLPVMGVGIAAMTCDEGRNQSGPSVRGAEYCLTSCAKSTFAPKCSSTDWT